MRSMPAASDALDQSRRWETYPSARPAPVHAAASCESPSHRAALRIQRPPPVCQSALFLDQYLQVLAAGLEDSTVAFAQKTPMTHLSPHDSAVLPYANLSAPPQAATMCFGKYPERPTNIHSSPALSACLAHRITDNSPSYATA